MRNNTKQYNKDELLFLPLGGSGEIGMNLNLYGYQGKWMMVDLGVTFTQDMGLEVLMPDPKFIVEQGKDLMGLVLTHAHEDHIGGIPYLWQRLRCPMYATPFTAALVRAHIPGFMGFIWRPFDAVLTIFAAPNQMLLGAALRAWHMQSQ